VETNNRGKWGLGFCLIRYSLAMELVQNIWTRYGFRGNPFDTAALSATAGDLLPIPEATAGRRLGSPESKMVLIGGAYD